jgi:hypothetical protein
VFTRTYCGANRVGLERQFKGEIKMAKLKIAHSSGGELRDLNVSPTIVNGTNVGGTGGLTSITGQQIQPQVFVTGGSSTTGSILTQKGARRFRVTDGTLTGSCTLVNNPNLTAGQMNILVTLNTGAANIAAANVAGGATSTTVTYDTRTAVTGPVSFPRVGDYLIWTSPSANVGGVVAVTAVNGTTDFTIGTVGNVADHTGVVLSTATYANRISNKFVIDYNNVKFRYHLAAADSTFVKVNSA